jgi:hypothetical protein
MLATVQFDSLNTSEHLVLQGRRGKCISTRSMASSSISTAPANKVMVTVLVSSSPVGALTAAHHGNSVLSNCAGQRNAVKENAGVCDVDFVRLAVEPAVGVGIRDTHTADAIDRHRQRRVDTPVTANASPHCAVGIPS